MKKDLQLHKIDISTSLPLKYADEGIRAGFPSPAQDYLEQAIDLNKELIKHPASTFYGRVIGDSSMEIIRLIIFCVNRYAACDFKFA